MQVIYSGSSERPFYTDIMGKHQWLPNGNMLITESTKGRAFEIDPEGALVWEYFHLVDKGRLALLDEASACRLSLPPRFSRKAVASALRGSSGRGVNGPMSF